MRLLRNLWVAGCLFVGVEALAAPFVVDVPMEVEADRFAVARAQLKRKSANLRLDVYKQYGAKPKENPKEK